MRAPPQLIEHRPLQIPRVLRYPTTKHRDRRKLGGERWKVHQYKPPLGIVRKRNADYLYLVGMLLASSPIAIPTDKIKKEAMVHPHTLQVSE